MALKYKFVDSVGRIFVQKNKFSDIKEIIHKACLNEKGAIKRGKSLFKDLTTTFPKGKPTSDFIRELANEVLNFKNNADSEWIAKEAEEEKNKRLEETNCFLRQWYSAKAIKKVMPVLGEDMKRNYETTMKEKEINYDLGLNKSSHAWKKRQKDFILKIREIYLNHSPLKSDNQISYSMSLAFKATEITLNEQETIRKYLRSFKIKPNSKDPS